MALLSGSYTFLMYEKCKQMLVDGKKILICLNYIINLIKDIRNHFIKSFLYWMVLKLLEYQISKKVGMAEMVCCFRKIHLKWPHFWANSKCSHGTSIDAQGIFFAKDLRVLPSFSHLPHTFFKAEGKKNSI